MNLDDRSERRNTELGIIIDSAELAGAFLHMTDFDSSVCRLRLSAARSCRRSPPRASSSSLVRLGTAVGAGASRRRARADRAAPGERTRPLTTEWFARRVDERCQRCRGKGGGG